VVAEVALAVVLLIGAGLLLRSFARLLEVDPGFRTARAFSFDVDLPPARYPKPARRLFLDRVLDRLQALPGVTAVGAASMLPLSGNGNFDSLLIEGRPLPKPQEMPPLANDIQTTPGYFEAMGIPLQSGRTFTVADRPEGPRVAVIDDLMAKTYWPRENPLGKRFRLGEPNDKTDPWYTVVGVVGSVRNLVLDIAPSPQMYLAAAQHPPLQQSFVVRTSGDPRTLLSAARAAIREADREQPIARLGTLEETVSTSVASRRVSLFLLGLFAALALLLSAIGIYGVTAHSVTERTREMGLRLALGAQRGGVLRLVVGEAGALVGAGVLLGLAAGFALTRVMTSLLYGVAATDPATFAGVALGLTGIALAAAYLPGRRATRVDPMVALRSE
jgi:predicted permease